MSNELTQYHILHKRMANKYAKQVQLAIRDQLKPVVQLVEQGQTQQALLATMQAPMLPIAAVIKRMYKDCAVTYGWQVYRGLIKQVKVPEDFIAEMANFIEQYFRFFLLNKAVLPIDAYTKEIVFNVINEGVRNGDNYRTIAAAIYEKGIPVTRAMRIARTESAKALQVGADHAAERTGIEVVKVWLSAQSPRTRRLPKDLYDHLNMNGVQVPMDGYFEVPKRSGGTERMKHPCDPNGSAGNVIQCRCTVAYRPRRDENGKVVVRQAVENNFVQID